MKILVIAPTPFFADRGCHVRIFEEIKSLEKLGHNILLCTYGLGRDIEGLNIKRSINFPWYKKLEAGPSITKIFLLPFLIFTVLKQTKKFKPDIIHAHLHEGAVIARVVKFFFPEKKFLFDMQGSLTKEIIQHAFTQENSLVYKLFRFIERKIIKWFPIITSSENYKDEFTRLGIEPDPKKVNNIGDGVDLSFFYPRNFHQELAEQWRINYQKPRVMFMGLLEEYQGIDLMLEAFKYVKEHKPDTQFLIIGFPNIEYYKAQCREHGIEDQVTFMGKVNYLELPDYLSLSDIAIAPKISTTEGDGKIYNYMSMGMATVSWDRELSHKILGKTGIFAEHKNTRDMAQKILELINHPEKVKKYGTLSLKRVQEEFSWDALGKRINEIYQSL